MSDQLLSISPIDGRYSKKTKVLQAYFSEFALIKRRLMVEILYFTELTACLPQLQNIDPKYLKLLWKKYEDFSLSDALIIKTLEEKTQHDVKAVEYYLQIIFSQLGIQKYNSFIHFGLTSQDINNTAIPLLLKDSLREQIFPSLENLKKKLKILSIRWENISMLGYTHGQSASPTYLGKELSVFTYRLKNCISDLKKLPIPAKFGGAVGNFNAHYLAYPDIDWVAFSDNFVNQKLGLKRCILTTQIGNYDGLSHIFNVSAQINTILIDLCRDMWQYISLNYFKQKVNKQEVGSSTMPHKINPIDFENAEGNLGLANAIFTHLAQKLPVSRLQRDLSDSTVLRNIGVPFAHQAIALNSIEKGLQKLILNKEAIDKDLDSNWIVISEGIQTILRREGVENAYELLKNFTRNYSEFNQSSFSNFIETLNLRETVKQELRLLKPNNYVGLKFKESDL